MRESADYIPTADLPPIPEKRYFSISEVGTLCSVKPHVLRYWEQEFPSLCPVKRRGNRRYYQLEDIVLIRQIRALLYEQGHTLMGAKAKLSSPTKPLEKTSRNAFKSLIEDLKSLKKMLEPIE